MRLGRLKVSRGAETLSLVLVALACASHSVGPAPGGGPPGAHDWTRFGWDAGGSNAPPIATGITAANVTTLVRQQVAIDGTVDASAIYLHRVPVSGSTHDVFFVTTTYGKTLAIDAQNGAVLWRYTPANYASWAGTAQVTTATPVADPNRQFVYAAAPDGAIRKLRVADGSVVWTTAITLLPAVEKTASALNFFNGRVIATTTGYIGDAPPYQGHVALLAGATGNLLSVWNSLCSNRPGLIDPASCAQSGSGIWGRTGAVIDSSSGTIFVATGPARPRLARAERDRRADPGARLERDERRNPAPGGRRAGRVHAQWQRPVQRAGRAAQRDGHMALRGGGRRYGGMAVEQRPAAAGLGESERRDEPGHRRHAPLCVRPERGRTARVPVGHRGAARGPLVRGWTLE